MLSQIKWLENDLYRDKKLTGYKVQFKVLSTIKSELRSH